MPSQKPREAAMKAIQNVFARYQEMANAQKSPNFDRSIVSDLELIDVDGGRSTFELTATETYSNLNGVMHGGAIGTVFGYVLCGDSMRNANQIVDIWARIKIHAEVLAHGKTMAMIHGRITSPDGKAVYAAADHHKVNSPKKPEHRSAVGPEKPQKANL
ncbi:MAG: hypothetical protein M1819_005142 [Sarea resinae]|nr:MAG: hypothetical protein M1819_005142 [Sarea resinae]